MRRRELLRRAVWSAVGGTVSSSLPAAAAGPAAHRQFPEGYDASRELARPDWKPVFLSAHQDATLIALGDRIIPDTDAPGAVKALCNRFIDRLLAAQTPEVQRSFLASLAYVDGECLERYRSTFVHLPEAAQVEFLKFVAYPHTYVTWGDNRSEFAGHGHFRNLKSWITRAYYGSEIGQKALGWDDNVFHGDFAGCTHPEKTHV